MSWQTLVDVLRGASNAAASTVSGPVDLIAAGLGKAGVPIDEPVGGSAWMKRQGLTAEPENYRAGLVGETIGNVLPFAAAAKAPQIAGALRKGAENLATPRTLNPQKGAIVWDGSPHRFEQFNASKIGTGEGAQAYGHGLYFAENPEVARAYAKDAPYKTFLGTEAIDPSHPQFDAVMSIAAQGHEKAVADTVKALESGSCE